MGIVYHSNYLEYFEVGRTELFRELKLTYKELEENHGIMMPIASISCEYKKSAFYDDLLEIKTWITEMPKGARIEFQYEVYKEGLLTPIVTAKTILAFVDIKTKKVIACPPIILQKLKETFA